MLRRIHVTLVKMILARGNHFVITRLHSSYSNLDQRVTAGCKGKKHSRKKMLKVILLMLLKMSLIPVLNQKLSSNRDAVEMLNNYLVWTCV